jgi:hypothetical protein
MIRFKKVPKFGKTVGYLEKLTKYDVRPLLHQMGKMGVRHLSQATPKDSGETAAAWSYKIKGNKERYKLVWTNAVVAGRAPLVLLLQYGHATKSGYFLSGRDFINPALTPVYDTFLARLGQEVSHHGR